MRKWRLMACAMALGVMLSVPVMAADSLGNLPAEGAKAYLGTVQDLAKKYGTNRNSKVDQTFLSGLACSRIIDFDGDGIPELYCAWGSNADQIVQHQAIWTYTSAGLQRILYQDSVSNFGTDVSPETLLYIGDKKAYLVDGREIMNGGVVAYYTKSGNAMKKVLTYTDEMGEYPDGTDGKDICTLNGKTISKTDLHTSLQKFTAGMTECAYSYTQDPYGGQDVKTSVPQSIALLKTVVYPKAKVSSSTLIINGQPVSTQAYQIDGNNYYKLRDLAYVLNGSGKQFAISWNAQQQRIDLLLHQPYTAVGGEGNALTGTAQASLSAANIWMNGAKIRINSYQIGGNTYLKLRDLASAMDFGVTWDDSIGGISVDTITPYQANGK